MVNGDNGQEALFFTIKVGETLTLNAEGSKDPDGDLLSYHWFLYPEAGSTQAQPVPFNEVLGHLGEDFLQAPPILEIAEDT